LKKGGLRCKEKGPNGSFRTGAPLHIPLQTGTLAVDWRAFSITPLASGEVPRGEKMLHYGTVYHLYTKMTCECNTEDSTEADQHAGDTWWVSTDISFENLKEMRINKMTLSCTEQLLITTPKTDGRIHCVGGHSSVRPRAPPTLGSPSAYRGTPP